ncbi:MAG: hypothetical protein KC649_02085 [Candidatus Omnitrophica bacterium]|nr:hypothetical protein [Candidatus Omnitrophota bacterium]
MNRMGQNGANRQKDISRLLRMKKKSRHSQLHSGADPSRFKEIRKKDSIPNKIKPDRLAAYLLILSLTAGCAAPKSVMLHPEMSEESGSEIGELRGFAAVVSTGASSVVHAAAFRLKAERLIFHLSFENTGSAPLDIDPRSVVLYGSRGDRTEQLEIISADEYMEHLEGEQHKKEVATGMLADVAAIAGSMAAGLIPYAGAAVGLAQQAFVNPQMNKKINESIAQSRRDLHITKDVLLKPHRLYPQSKSEGIVVSEFKRMDRYELQIPVGDEIHRVDFQFE